MNVQSILQAGQQVEQRQATGGTSPGLMTVEEQGQFMRRKAAERTAEKRREDVSVPCLCV